MGVINSQTGNLYNKRLSRQSSITSNYNGSSYNSMYSGLYVEDSKVNILADRVIVLSKRPSHIKNMYEIKLNNKKDPISNRSDNKFSYYYELIAKDLDVFNE